MDTSPANPPRRRHLRLRDYDYAQAGAYFITICTYGRECLFGSIYDGMMETNDLGRLITDTRLEQMNAPGTIRTDEWVVMPNHFYAIAFIEWHEVGSRTAPTKSLGRVVNAFKTVSAKKVNLLRGTPGTPVWQRNYYEHVVRTEEELHRIRDYIRPNPAKWDEDPDNRP
jgi:putative transposase